MVTSVDHTEKVYNFATGFLSLNNRQRAAFFINVTHSQCKILISCAYNVLLNSSLDISVDDRKYLRRHSSIIRKIASKRICLSDKKHMLVKKASLVSRLLKIVVIYLDKDRECVSSSTTPQLESLNDLQ